MTQDFDSAEESATGRPKVNFVPIGIREQVEERWVLDQLHGPYGYASTCEALETLQLRLDAVSGLLASRMENTSRSRLGSLAHRVMRKLTRRQVDPLVNAIEAMKVVFAELTGLLIAQMRSSDASDTARLRRLQVSVVERLALVDVLEARIRMIEESMSES